MYKRVSGRKIPLLLLFFIFMFTACSSEALLSEVPETFHLERDSEVAEDEVIEKQSHMGDVQGTKEAIGQNKTEVVESSAEYISSVAESTGNVSESTQVAEKLLLAEKEEVSTYAYNSLSPEMQIWYKNIEDALGNMKNDVRLADECLEAGLDEKHIDTIFQCVLNDHPEIFYVDGYTYTKYSRGDTVVAISFSGTYQMSMEDALVRKEEIEQAIAPILAGISMNASDYDKVKYVFDTIIKNTNYDLSAPDNQNIYSVFVGHRSVCQGYAKATQYLLNKLNIESTLVQGTVDNGEGHAWNLVCLDDSWYYVDTTWGDASYQMQGDSGDSILHMPEVNYDYLCVTTEQLLRTHVITPYVPMPECVDTAANYYVREGTLLTEYNKEQVQQLFWKMLEEKRTDLTLKCSNESCFNEVKVSLIDNQEIFDYLPADYGKISYAHNEGQLSLTFWVTNPQ